MAFPTTTPSYIITAGGEVLGGAAGGTGLSGLLNALEVDVTALGVKVGTGASTPINNTFFIGTGTGTSSWSTLTSAQLAARVTNETGSGSLVFGTSPTIATPSITTPTITSGGSWSGSPTITTPSITAITNGGTITLPTGTDTLIARATTDTLTNKRITVRTGTTASSATPTIDTDNVDFYSITAQAETITSFTTNLSGTPTEAQKLWIAITGTASQIIIWGASFEAGAVILPTTTILTERLDVGFIWNATTLKWRCMASGSA